MHPVNVIAAQIIDKTNGTFSANAKTVGKLTFFVYEAIQSNFCTILKKYLLFNNKEFKHSAR